MANDESRNPFIFLGHFNYQEGEAGCSCEEPCRNPFIFLGHFNRTRSTNLIYLSLGRNPFIFLGHFNLRRCSHEGNSEKGRNPFIFLGHFNPIMTIIATSQQ